MIDQLNVDCRFNALDADGIVVLPIYYRCHPLLLNAAFLGNPSADDQRILDFRDKSNYLHAFERPPKHTMLQNSFRKLFEISIRIGAYRERVAARLKRMTVARQSPPSSDPLKH